MATSGGTSLGSGAARGGGPANDGIVRGEIVERDGRRTFVALRRLRWGTQILSEKPLMLVEADPAHYLKAPDADVRLPQLAEALGDAWRVAAYIAFKQLHERKQKEVLALWYEGIESSDNIAARLWESNQRGVDMFLQDRPEFSRLIYWHHFVLVACIFGRFGVKNPDGTRAVYALCSQLRHSCRPNAAWFTLRRGFPKGRKQLHVIATDGIPRGEEITVSEEAEATLLLPKSERAKRLFGGSGQQCSCVRCCGDEEKQEERIGVVMTRLHKLLGIRPPTDESTKEAFSCLKELDVLLPFSMVSKAKAKVLLASLFSELSHRATWQEENRGGNIIQWTGLDAESQEQRLRDTKKLYETAAKDFEYLLGQDALGILQRLEAGYAPINDHHKLLAKYTKREPNGNASESPPPAVAAPPYPAAGAAPPPAPHLGGSASTAGREALPPGWDEIFQTRKPMA
mmetsp:Transcript_79929/g.232032  ORF Transcript_79929/g.232032 Transcript_79929/m.232032 type:complete len:457 (-) Transcript_79929:38-1408(-)